MKILIDNGHGKETPGKCSPDGRLKEYAYTREIADRVVTGLQNEGIDAMRIVPGENDVALFERVEAYQCIRQRSYIGINPLQCDGEWCWSGCLQTDGAYLMVTMLQ